MMRIKRVMGVSTKVVRAPTTIMFFWNKPNLPKRKKRVIAKGNAGRK